MITQCINDHAGFRQHASLLLDLAPSESQFKVLTDLLQQLALHFCNTFRQGRNLVYTPIAFEVRHELYNSLQQLCAFPILPALAKAQKLFIRSREHLQSLERRHG